MSTDPDLTKSNFWIIAINSTASYVLAFLIVFYINHFVKILIAGSYRYELGFDWSEIRYYIEAQEWTHDSVTLIFSSGPILIFVVGLISLIAFWSLVEEPARIKTLLMWITLHSFNLVFGGLLIGNIFKKGVGHVFNWMYLTDTSKMVVALLGFIGLLGTAYFMAKPAAISANSYYNKLDSKNFPFFITAQIVVPFILGTIFYLGFFMPNLQFQETYSWISLAMIILFIIGRISKMETIYFDEDDRFIKLSPIIVLTTIIVFFTFRFVLFRNEIFISW